MSYRITNTNGLGAYSDVEYFAAADSIATEFDKVGKWEDANANSFIAWANVAYDERGGAFGVEWFEQVVDDRWRNGPGCITSAYSSGCSVDATKEEAMRARLIVLGDRVTAAKAKPSAMSTAPRVLMSAKITPKVVPVIPPILPVAPPPPPPSPPAPTSWWANLSETEQYAVIGGGFVGVAAIGAVVYFKFGKKKATAVPTSAPAAAVAKANRRRAQARW